MKINSYLRVQNTNKKKHNTKKKKKRMKPEEIK